MDIHERYSNPLSNRYASENMVNNFSEKRKVILWRQLWIWLAEAQQHLGVEITDEQLDEMRANKNNIDFNMAADEEKSRRHDVMAHVYTFASVCPKASSIIHLGATSCFVTDNADLIIIRQALDILLVKLAKCIQRFSKQAVMHKDLVCLGRTHLQPAQPTTMGRRICMWIQDLLMDLENLETLHNFKLRFRGVKGAVGTQASFLDLFQGNEDKVNQLEKLLLDKSGFTRIWTVTGQTYPRKFDSELLNSLSSLGSTIHKICTDIRLLSSINEIEEPFESTQIGSSAMPYKRNPIRSERACSLARYLMYLSVPFLSTGAVQWLERSLDDSAIRRITIPEACLSADACLQLLQNIAEGLVVYPKVMAANLQAELPFLAVERILVTMVSKASADRQQCHERLRMHAHATATEIKSEGLPNRLVEKLMSDAYFEPIHNLIPTLLNPRNFIGRAPQQVESFVSSEVEPALQPYQDGLSGSSVLVV